MGKKRKTAYLVLGLALCALPSAGLLWRTDTEATGADSFDERFAYREELVTANALILGKLFGVSAEAGVILGTDGWLYYKDSLHDYLGDEVLDDRAVYNIAHTYRMMQDYVEQHQGTFVFAVAPNKNSLYGSHMPYYYQKKAGNVHNWDKLQRELQRQNVNYADLHTLLGGFDEVLYHKRDSHWNNKGAALAAEEILNKAKKEHADYGSGAYEIRRDFEGDLDAMLYPLAVTPEDEIYFTKPFLYQYKGDVKSNFDPEIDTVQPQAQGSLLMYRDSFGNALLPFFAEEFAEARFSRGVPYYLSDMIFCHADTVIVERAERFLPDMAQNPPVMQAPEAELPAKQMMNGGNLEKNHADCQAFMEGLYLKLSGTVEKTFLDVESKIYMRIDGETVYEAFPASVRLESDVFDYGYIAYIEGERFSENSVRVELFTQKDGKIIKVYDDIVAFAEK